MCYYKENLTKRKRKRKKYFEKEENLTKRRKKNDDNNVSIVTKFLSTVKIQNPQQYYSTFIDMGADTFYGIKAIDNDVLEEYSEKIKPIHRKMILTAIKNFNIIDADNNNNNNNNNNNKVVENKNILKVINELKKSVKEITKSESFTLSLIKGNNEPFMYYKGHVFMSRYTLEKINSQKTNSCHRIIKNIGKFITLSLSKKTINNTFKIILNDDDDDNKIIAEIDDFILDAWYTKWSETKKQTKMWLQTKIKFVALSEIEKNEMLHFNQFQKKKKFKQLFFIITKRMFLFQIITKNSKLITQNNYLIKLTIYL